jgi:hypothetical protein
MRKIKLCVYISLILLIFLQIYISTTIIYAEDIQQFYGYKSNIDFKKDYEFELLEYSFLIKENKINYTGFIKNYAYINQNGEKNESKIYQIGGIGSIVEIIQIGNENNAIVKQFASLTRADVFQFGNNHDLSIEQWGIEAKIYVIQSGNNYENKEIKIVQF